ncbi:MAG: acyl-CoA dehydrogenase family protein, partial [Nitrospinota bacterium]
MCRWGSERQKERWLGALLRGETIGCCALAEPEAGLNTGRFLTRAEPRGKGWLLNGNKSSVLNGGVSDLAIVFAKTPGEGGREEHSAFLLEAGREGFSREAIKDKVGLRAASLADLSFKDCPLGPEDLLGSLGAGEEIFRSAVEEGQFSSAAGSLGLAQASLDAATEYSLERKAFGRAIAGFQLVQDMIARMVVDVEAARLMVYRAAVLKDSGAPAAPQVAMAKHFASGAALRAADDALQIHGGYGYSDEYPVERFLRDARAT